MSKWSWWRIIYNAVNGGIILWVVAAMDREGVQFWDVWFIGLELMLGWAAAWVLGIFALSMIGKLPKKKEGE